MSIIETHYGIDMDTKHTIIKFLEWYYREAQNATMRFETDNEDIAMMFIEENPEFKNELIFQDPCNYCGKTLREQSQGCREIACYKGRPGVTSNVRAIPIQLCPKCNGQGTVSKPPYVPGDVHQWSSSSSVFPCDVCNGQKTIAQILVEPTKGS